MTPLRAHAPRKRFGQNFLVAEDVVAAIVAAIRPRPDDRLVEIGPGLAALTQPLLACVRHVDVVEIDRDLVAALRARFAEEHLTIHAADALAFDFARLGSDLRIVGNLPYNVSTPLLFHLAAYADRVRDMHFMLQREVVLRMVAPPGNGDYGRLSVMLQYRFAMEQLLDVPPEAFQPRPRVHSALVRMLPRPAEELGARDASLFARVVQAAFGQRRKMLRNTLRGIVAPERLDALGIAPTARAEELAPADFVRIANALAT